MIRDSDKSTPAAPPEKPPTDPSPTGPATIGGDYTNRLIKPRPPSDIGPAPGPFTPGDPQADTP